jgi:hypothetical protein
MAVHAAVHAAIANAVKATGVIVRLEPAEWLSILKRTDAPLVVVGRSGVFKKDYQYLTTYRGLAFFTKSPSPIVLPGRAEVIVAKSIAVPEL